MFLFFTNLQPTPLSFEEFSQDHPGQARLNASALVHEVYPAIFQNKCSLSLSTYAIVMGLPRILDSMIYTEPGKIADGIDLYYCGNQEPDWTMLSNSICLNVNLSLMLLTYQNTKQENRRPYTECFYYVDSAASKDCPCLFDETTKHKALTALQIAIHIHDLEKNRLYQELGRIYYHLADLESGSLTAYRYFCQTSERYLYQAINKGSLAGFSSAYNEEQLNHDYAQKEKNMMINWDDVLRNLTELSRASTGTTPPRRGGTLPVMERIKKGSDSPSRWESGISVFGANDDSTHPTEELPPSIGNNAKCGLG